MSKQSVADLAIAGLVPLSTVDWPGKLAATVFLQGCPLACPYCHNEAIIDPRTPGLVLWKSVEDLLAKRRGLLDGVVFTGGEALRQSGVVEAAKWVKNQGFQVGLHTSGVYPTRLQEILPFTDWVGFDIKALPDNYKEQTGVAAGEKAWDSLALLLKAAQTHPGVHYEVRTTVYPGAPAVKNFGQMLSSLRAMGVENFALQEARTEGAPVQFRADALAWDLQKWKNTLATLIEQVEQAGFKHHEIRPA